MKPGEHKTVQARILGYAEAIGWTIVSREEAEQRRGFDPAVPPAEGALLGQFRHLHTDIYGNREFVERLRNRGKFFDHEEKRERDLILIDYDDPARNVYEVTEEWAFHNGHYGTREDVVFLINGIPVLGIECKNANKDEAIALGVDEYRQDKAPVRWLVPAPHRRRHLRGSEPNVSTVHSTRIGAGAVLRIGHTHQQQAADGHPHGLAEIADTTLEPVAPNSSYRAE